MSILQSAAKSAKIALGSGLWGLKNTRPQNIITMLMRVLVLAISLLVFAWYRDYVVTYFHNGTWPWLRQNTDLLFFLEWVGTFGFASAGIYPSIRKGCPWFVTIFSAIALSTFGGGLRDVLFLRRTPWFIADPHLVIVVIVFALLFMFIYNKTTASKKPKGLIANNACSRYFINKSLFLPRILLVVSDAIGILAFSVIAVVLAIRYYSPLHVVLLCSIFTQLGGGWLAGIARRNLPETLKANKVYYFFASCISISVTALIVTGNHITIVLVILLAPTVLLGILADNDYRQEFFSEFQKSKISACVRVQLYVIYHAKQIAYANKFYALRRWLYSRSFSLKIFMLTHNQPNTLTLHIRRMRLLA